MAKTSFQHYKKKRSAHEAEVEMGRSYAAHEL